MKKQYTTVRIAIDTKNILDELKLKYLNDNTITLKGLSYDNIILHLLKKEKGE